MSVEVRDLVGVASRVGFAIAKGGGGNTKTVKRARELESERDGRR